MVPSLFSTESRIMADGARCTTPSRSFRETEESSRRRYTGWKATLIPFS